MAVAHVGVEVFQQPDRGPAPCVPLQLDEVDRVRERERAREIAEEDEARLQRRDEQRLQVLVVVRDLGRELVDAPRDLRGGEVGLTDARIARYETRSSLNRSTRRAMSRL
jgi:hypothetical protein